MDRPKLTFAELYVYATTARAQCPSNGVVGRSGTKPRSRRRGQFRTITVSALPAEGYLPSEVLKAAQPARQRPRNCLQDSSWRLAASTKNRSELPQPGARDDDVTAMIVRRWSSRSVTPPSRHRLCWHPVRIAGALAFLVTPSRRSGHAFSHPILIGVIVSHVFVLSFIERRTNEASRWKRHCSTRGSFASGRCSSPWPPPLSR